MLKNLLALLLAKFYSKQESGEVAKQSYPSTAATTIQLTPSDGVTNKEMSYTPPSDGYIVLRDQGLPQSSSYLITGQYAEGIARGDKILFDFLMMTPVLKGVPVTIRYCGQGSVAQFIKNIGGGYKALKKLILQGGGLCLSHWFSSLRRSSCRVRERGFNTQSVHHSMRSTSLSLKTMCGTLLRLVPTVTLRSQGTPQVSFWKFRQAAQGLLIDKYLRGDTSFLSQKVSHSHTWCHLIQLLTRFSLSQCRLKTNPAVGGASC